MNLQKYILMNQNFEVLEFNFDEELNVIAEVLEIKNIDYAPYKLKVEYDSTKSINRLTINNWYSGRGIPINRDNIKEIIEQFNIGSAKELINKHFALSLSDQYWVKPADMPIKWENINYFDNNYDTIGFANATFGENATSSIKGISSISSNKFKTPNNTTDGQLKKVWLKVNGENLLYKASGSLYNFEPINEALASKICEILEVPYVPYSIDVIHSKRQDTLVSICNCAISKNQEIVTAYNILSKYEGQGFQDYYNKYLNILEENNVPKAKEYIEKMFMLDYIVLNEDRHLNNFGIIRDVTTLKWVSVCPIFDTGRSMNTNVTDTYWDFKIGEVKFFSPNLVPCEVLTDIFTISISKEQIQKLKDLTKYYETLLNQYKEYTKLTDEQISKLINGYLERVSIFESKMNEKGLIKY